MINPVRIVFTVLFCLCLVTAMGQTPKPGKPAVRAGMQKFKPPKLYTAISVYNDSIVVSRAEALLLMNQPLRINDDKKNIYSISSYQFMYLRRSVTENEETGKVTPITSPAITLFRTSPISVLWRNIITEELKSGEELYFFDVIVKDTNGRLMFAPTFKIKIK